MTGEQTGLRRLLELLHDSGFEHIVIGGTAAIAHGAVTPTQKGHLRRPKDKIVEAELRAIRDRLRDGGR